jgi:hypothetical protein
MTIRRFLHICLYPTNFGIYDGCLLTVLSRSATLLESVPLPTRCSQNLEDQLSVSQWKGYPASGAAASVCHGHAGASQIVSSTSLGIFQIGVGKAVRFEAPDGEHTQGSMIFPITDRCSSVIEAQL